MCVYPFLFFFFCHSRLTFPQDKKAIAQNLADQAKYARLLVIWTDCDREGEHIGQEIVDAAKKGNSTIQIKRAKFSNVERAYVEFYLKRTQDSRANTC